VFFIANVDNVATLDVNDTAAVPTEPLIVTAADGVTLMCSLAAPSVNTEPD